jgi:hypothetical protein
MHDSRGTCPTRLRISTQRRCRMSICAWDFGTRSVLQRVDEAEKRIYSGGCYAGKTRDDDGVIMKTFTTLLQSIPTLINRVIGFHCGMVSTIHQSLTRNRCLYPRKHIILFLWPLHARDKKPLEGDYFGSMLGAVSDCGINEVALWHESEPFNSEDDWYQSFLT